MSTTDGIVNSLFIAQGKGIVSGLRLPVAIQRLRELEPHLAEFVTREVCALRKLMVEAGVPDRISSEIVKRHWSTILISHEAIKHATYDLWEGTEVAKGLAQADPAVADMDHLAAYRQRAKAKQLPPGWPVDGAL